MSTPKQLFSIRIKELRIQKGLTQQQLGELVGSDKKAVNHWEKERNAANLETLWQLADYFQCSLDFLVGRSDTP
jgi:Predicted transcriptional regulators